MKEKIFRTLALLLALSSVWVVLFVPSTDQMTLSQIIGSLVVSALFLAYAIGGQKLFSKIPFFGKAL